MSHLKNGHLLPKKDNNNDDVGTQVLIQASLKKYFDSETYAKFQQILDNVNEKLYNPLFEIYNTQLLLQFQALGVDDGMLPVYINHKLKFYAFKFIREIGKLILKQKICPVDGDCEDLFLLLTKVLLYHALTSKHITFSLALVELEQLCVFKGITLNELYQKYRPKLLRVIIKSVLMKLMEDRKITSNNENSSINGSDITGIDRVKKYMTRALLLFDVFTLQQVDIFQSLVIITNLIHKETYDNDAMKLFLESLSNHCDCDLSTLIRRRILDILVTLLLKKKLSHFDITASLTVLCSFCDKTLKEMFILADQFTLIKSRLLLNYCSDTKTVTDSIYYLSKFEKEEHEQPFEDEFDDEKNFIDYLNPNLIGILFHIDDHFTANRGQLGTDESIGQILSLRKILTSLDSNQVKTIHVKLFSSLSLLVQLRPKTNDRKLNLAIVDLWTVFVSKLSPDLLASLLINIYVSLYDLIEDCPEEIATIYLDLLSKNEPGAITNHLKSLFFIPDIPPMKKLLSRLAPHIGGGDIASNLQELQRSINCVLPLLKLESQRCHVIALTKIKRLLTTNQGMIISSMLTNQDEPLDGVISKTIEYVIALSSTQDPECSSLIADCLGIIGAVNPIRLDHLIYGEISSTSANVTNLYDSSFVVGLIERLKNSLFSDERRESETANYVLQIVCKNYRVFSDKNITNKLSGEAIKACVLCKNTKYYTKQDKLIPNTSQCVYEKMKTDNQFSYKDWLNRFSLNLVGSIPDKIIQEVLTACIFLFKYNLKLGEFLIPNLVIYMICMGLKQVEYIRKEIGSVIEEDVGVSTQDLDNVYNDDVRGSLQELHLQCANMTFSIMDAVDKLDFAIKVKTSGEDAVKLTQKQLEQFKLIKSVPRDKLAKLASRCRSHARALRYYEEFLTSTNGQLDKHATALQRIYIALDDTFEAAGIEMIRDSPTNLGDDIVNYEACGRYDRAYICCTTSLDSTTDANLRELFIEDSLQCLSNQGDYHRLYEKTKVFIDEYQHLKRNLLPYAVEAQYKLGKWDDLDISFRSEQYDSILERPPVSQGFLLFSLNEENKSISEGGKLEERLMMVRQKLMKPLSIAMMDRSAYFRGYHSMLVAHSIEDFSSCLSMINEFYSIESYSDESTIHNMREKLTNQHNLILDLWGRRNNLVEPSLRSLEPLLAWQRSINMALAKKIPFLEDKINIDIGRMWLRSAESAREFRSYDRSFFCLTQARRWFGSKFDNLRLDLRTSYYIEQAQLDWDQGDRTRAIRILQLSLDRLSDHSLHEHLRQRMDARSKEHNNELIPNLDYLTPCHECSKIDIIERQSFTRLKTLLTHYCEEAAAGLPHTLFFMYEECVHLGVNQEETYFRLARYYDRLLTYYKDNPQLFSQEADDANHFDTQKFSQSIGNGNTDELFGNLMEHSIKAFGNSLKYGVRYLRESMPRLLNIWYDFASKKPRGLQSGMARAISSKIENTIRFIDDLKNRCLPPYYFMTAISILLTRVHHPHSGITKKTCEILELLLTNYPHQLSWLMIALTNDTEKEERRAASLKIIKSVKAKDQRIARIIEDTMNVSKILKDVCFNLSPVDPRSKTHKGKRLTGYVNIREICPDAVKFKFAEAQVMAPVQASMRAILPTNNSCDLKEHQVFPRRNLSFIQTMDSRVRIYNSLQQPRQISFLCDNGKTVNILCKSGDDLRKDSRCVEFLNLLNSILRLDSQSNARFFEIQTFLVLPIDKANGLIEMVPNCDSLKNIIEKLYKEQNPNFSLHDQYPKPPKGKEWTPNELLDMYVNKLLPKVSPPVLPTWFIRKFTEPTSWYMARLAYTRSAAVSSMGGYIIGLGDRHLDNILIDTCTGRLVHVDFNLLFHQGENLPTPERVPFRLTHNMIAAFGSLGIEGNFRRVCEITMRVMRKEKDALLTTLKPFMHDPCSEWVKSRNIRDRSNQIDIDKHKENEGAKLRIEVTERKLKGFPRSQKFKPLTLIDSYSVEAQVNSLIEEAADAKNLALMYFGWAPNL